MRIERTKNATRNIFFGLILKMYQILLPFLLRTALIYFMGIEYLGLNSLFSSILQVLNLAELGVGSAMVYSMYKPIANDDKVTICALMKLYKVYYTGIGIIIGVVGGILTPFIPKLISGNVPKEINIYVLYLLNLAATVLSYLFLAYRGSLLQAHQRVDVISKISLVTSTVQYIFQLVVLLYFKNYYYFILVVLFAQALTNIVIAWVSKRMYPDYEAEGELDKHEVKIINRRIKDLFTSKIGSVVVDSADTIVISAYLGLTVLAIYQNYFYILSSIMAFLMIVFSSCTAGIGNSIIVETPEKNFNDLKKFTMLICWIAGFCSCCLLNLYQLFMEWWVGKDLMLDLVAVYCFVIYFYIQEINKLLNTYKDAAGIWHEDRFRPLVVAIINLCMNLSMVQLWGIYGILLSTVLATLLVGMPWILKNLFSTIFDRKYLRKYVSKLLYFCVVTSVECVLSVVICEFIFFENIWFTMIGRGLVCGVVSNGIFVLMCKSQPEFRDCIKLLDYLSKGRLRILKKLY